MGSSLPGLGGCSIARLFGAILGCNPDLINPVAHWRWNPDNARLYRVRGNRRRGRMKSEVLLFVGEELGSYGFPDGHPFSVDRQGAFWKEAQKQNLDKRVTLAAPRRASREELLRFHDEKHVSWVETRSRIGSGYLDYGDTPAF